MPTVTVGLTTLCSPEYDCKIAEYSGNHIKIQSQIIIRFSYYFSTDM